MLIRDVMTADVISVEPDVPLSKALDLIVRKRISFIVVAREQQPVGVLTEGDIVALASENVITHSQPVSSVMVSPPITVRDDLNVFLAYDELLNHHIRHIVVVNADDQLVGVVTTSNFLASMGIEHLARLRHVSEEASTAITTVSADTPMSEVIASMHHHRHAMIAVEQGQPVGILTSRDITEIFHHQRDALHTETMRDYMRSPVLTLSKSAFIPEANNLMRRHRTRHIVIVEGDGSLYGLLTISDVVRSLESKYIAFMKALMQEMEQDLRLRSIQQTALFDRNPNAVFSLDTQSRVCAINPACVLLTGLDEEEMEGRLFVEFLQGEACEAFSQACDEAFQGQAGDLQASMQDKDGRLADVFLNLVPVIVDGQCTGLYVVAHDVTERLQAERHACLLTSALEQANESVVIINAEGELKFANQACQQLLDGSHDSEVLGKHLDQLFQLDCCQDAQTLWALLREQGNLQLNTQMRVPKRDEELSVRVAASRFSIGQERGEHLVLVIEDMREQQAIENQLRQAQKMESLGTLVGGMAHDFNNLLASISGNLFLIREELEQQPATAKKVQVLEEECFRAAGLIQQLLIFARKGHVRKERLNICELLQNTLELGRMALYSAIALDVETPSQPVMIHGNQQQLQQVILNLLNNAADAVEHKIHPRIEVSLSCDEGEDGEYAVLTIRDNGSGIQKNDLAHIFEPFYTTKDVGKGSGLGLSMAYGAIEQHQGVLQVQSRFGHGAVFSIRLPRIVEEEALAEGLDLEHVAPHYILVADDEERVRSMCVRLLESRHYRVLQAESGEQALLRIEEYGDAIDLVVLDVMMPGMTGVDVWSHLIRERPKLPVLLMTGYDKQNVTSELPEYIRNAHVLDKPFYPQDFLARVEEMIGE